MSKEWLGDIKERFAKYQTDYNLNGEDVEWLIQQVERVQELENHLNLYDFWYRVVYEQNKRYREALNIIITLWIASTDATDDTWLAHEMSETARKALEGEKMTDKERLKDIKNARYFFHDVRDSDLLKDWNWLIEQAEKAEKFRKALEFYANEKSWMNRKVTILMDGEPTDVEDCPAIFDDGGNIARKALEG